MSTNDKQTKISSESSQLKHNACAIEYIYPEPELEIEDIFGGNKTWFSTEYDSLHVINKPIITTNSDSTRKCKELKDLIEPLD